MGIPSTVDLVRYGGAPPALSEGVAPFQSPQPG
jgi:hypothetical protein